MQNHSYFDDALKVGDRGLDTDDDVSFFQTARG